MPRDTLLLVRRATDDASVAETHAQRLRDREVADEVRIGTYESEPGRDLEPVVGDCSGDRLFAVPLCLAHTNATVEAVPAALTGADGNVRYCEPVGRSPAVTGAVLDRARTLVDDEGDASLVLVGFGASATPYNRRAVEYHARRARERSGYGEVVPCYLLQNPAVECVRYNVGDGPVVAVPLFVAPDPATEDEIAAKLELDRGGVEFADALGTHRRVTDAIEAEVAKQRVVGGGNRTGPASFEGALTATSRAMVTDGEGR